MDGHKRQPDGLDSKGVEGVLFVLYLCRLYKLMWFDMVRVVSLSIVYMSFDPSCNSRRLPYQSYRRTSCSS
jgi:hypothetical protein